MSEASPSAVDQKTLWNGAAGEAWVRGQDVLDAMFRPFEAMLADAAAGCRGRVLDVGCGTGATTLAVAAAAPEAECAGVDISEPMIAAAVAKAKAAGSSAQFFCADAQDHGFADASIEMIVSRFGVMFFRDPVAAFANLHRAATAGGRLNVIAWRSAADNPFMTTAERAAVKLIPDFPVRKAEGPGQFAFADAAHVRGILEAAGWRDVSLMPVDVACEMPEPALRNYLMQMGPLGVVLNRADAETRERLSTAVRAAFNRYVDGDTVRFDAACWTITARA
jgi:ubiquinone/menaquinone biosynthesis C-methylase UbiE